MTAATGWDVDIRKFIDAWRHFVSIRKLTPGRKYWNEISKEVDAIFNELTKVIGERGIWNTVICGSLYNQPGDTLCSSRCGEIVSLMLYMKGYNYVGNRTWQKRAKERRYDWEFEEYLKCILARETLLQLYGSNNDHRGIIQTVSDELKGRSKILQKDFADGICEGRDYGKVIFTSGDIGESIKKRLQRWTQESGRKRILSRQGRQQKCAWEEEEPIEQQKKPKDKGKCNRDEDVKEEGDTKDIMNWIRADTTPLTQYLFKVITSTRGLSAKCKVEEQIKGKVKDMQGTVQGTVTHTAKPQTPPGSNASGEKEWNQIKAVLEDFIQYLGDHNQDFEQYGANSDNKSWDDMEKGKYYRGQRVADMMRCRIMSGALWFANQQGPDEQTNKLRCEVAHVLGHLLKTKYCERKTPFTRGTEYAWQTFKNMQSQGQSGHGALQGPVMDGTCTMCGYVGHTRNITAINWKIAEWLLYNARIMEEIQKMERDWPCEQYWEKYIQENAKEGERDISKILTQPGIQKMQEVEKEIRDEAKKAFEGAKDKVQQEIDKHTGTNTHSTDTNSKNTNMTCMNTSIQSDTNNRPARTETAKNKEGASSPSGAVGRADDSAAEAAVPASAPPAAPASAAPAAAGSGAGGQGPGQGPGPGQQPPPPPPSTGNTCKEGSTSTNKNGSGVTLSFACTPDSALGGPSSIPLTPSDPAPGNKSCAP
ncbi:hypothetical protein AK88_04724 [Plasmodium fragile]|uniref:Schizont-infected cell agglutination extracellular alpha domain-containing protein n=1 Tax=Plasmodium fragile TaxID=5857 RepID=A0A0D9QFS7_PLAFR|nr:uncharacterized protein AK88_04724 [Plasmodium fragile]KJP85652.1 hypothetical protein AK88_04724 [Plasmodium fragile]